MRPSEYLVSLQRQHPPQNPSRDRAKFILDFLMPRLPAELKRQFQNQTIACAEIGKPTPNAVMKSLPPHGYAIEVWTGLERFLYRVAKAVATQIRVFDPGTAPVEPTLEFHETVAILRAVFQNMIQYGVSGGPSGYPIKKAQVEIAAGLTDHAEAFVFAHEIGHVTIKQNRASALQSGIRAMSPEEESTADFLALTYVLGIEGTPPQSPRMAYAGAEFAVRVFRCLGALGFRFEESHPLPSARLEAMRLSAQALFPQDHREVTTIAFAFDELLEAVERAVTQVAGPPIWETPQRIVSQLSVILEQFAKGDIGVEFVRSELATIFANLSNEVIKDVATLAASTLGAKAPPGGTHPAKKKASMFPQLVELLPDSAKASFRESLG